MADVIGVRFREEGKTYYFNPRGEAVKAGTDVIVETSRGVEYGLCVSPNETIDDSLIIQPLRNLIRVANDEDRKHWEENRQKEAEAFALCEQKIAEHRLDMKLVEVEYTLDCSKILFFFTSEGRVDFRELVKELAALFHTRIELRQIGVRDEAKMLGGLGICGRPFCCSTFMDEFQPVSIKMAKTQNLSLNPTKISGTCGRLMCCLKYEQDTYEDLIANSVKPDSYVRTADGRGTVTDTNIFRGTVSVKLDSDNDDGPVKTYKSSQVFVLRVGKKGPMIEEPEDLVFETEEPEPEFPIDIPEPLAEWISENLAEQEDSPPAKKSSHSRRHRKQSQEERTAKAQGGETESPDSAKKSSHKQARAERSHADSPRREDGTAKPHESKKAPRKHAKKTDHHSERADRNQSREQEAPAKAQEKPQDKHFSHKNRHHRHQRPGSSGGSHSSGTGNKT